MTPARHTIARTVPARIASRIGGPLAALAALAAWPAAAASDTPGVSAPAAAAAAPATATIPATGEGLVLTVSVEGVRSSAGSVRAGLLKAGQAGGPPAPAGGTAVAAVAGTTVLRFEGLQPGDYAVQLFHDEDGDGVMATNLFGIPTEGYGFSNRARAGFGPPSFAAMQVAVTDNATTTAVMAY